MNTLFAETLSEQQRKRARIHAYFACYSGCISEVMIDSSAIVIIYLSMLDCSKTEVMLSTGFTGIMLTFLLIPSAYIINRIGMRKSVSIACIAGCLGFLLMAIAPCFGEYRKVAAIAGCLIYCTQRSLYGATWYPMLDGFLRPQDRGRFFGTMRYTYMALSGVLFYILGKLMGEKPPMILMQSIVGITGLMILGRMYCMLQFPRNPEENCPPLKLKEALKISISNGPLVCYSVYVCMLSTAYSSLVPLTLLYLKEYVKLAPGTVQNFSTIGIAGSIIGFFTYSFLQKYFKLKHLEFFVHITFMFAALVIALLPMKMNGFLVIIGGVYFMISLATSIYLNNNSSELLALARPGNKTMAMAFQQTYQNIGVTISRTGCALIMGSNLLAPSWSAGSLEFSSYQTLFLLYGVIAAVLLLLLPTLPAMVPVHDDYYQP